MDDSSTDGLTRAATQGDAPASAVADHAGETEYRPAAAESEGVTASTTDVEPWHMGGSSTARGGDHEPVPPWYAGVALRFSDIEITLREDAQCKEEPFETLNHQMHTDGLVMYVTRLRGNIQAVVATGDDPDEPLHCPP